MPSSASSPSAGSHRRRLAAWWRSMTSCCLPTSGNCTMNGARDRSRPAAGLAPPPFSLAAAAPRLRGERRLAGERRPERAVRAARLEQLLVGADLSDPARVEHHDAVSAGGGTE